MRAVVLYTEHLVLDLVFIFILNVYSYKQTPYSRLFSYGVRCIASSENIHAQ